MAGITRDITERKKAEKEKDLLLHALGERLKELRCLYEISKLAGKANVSLEEILHGTTDSLPRAWQYPDIACARIIFENQEYKTKNFKETPWKQLADINVKGKKVGFVEVCYLQEKFTIADSPFSKEERDLIDAVAERLGKTIERKKMEEEIKTLARFSSENPNPVLRISQDFHVLFANYAGKALLAKLNWEVDGLVPAFLKNVTIKTLENQSSHTEECEVGGRIYEFYAIPIVDKGYVNVYVIDITERRKTQEILEESEARYRSLVEQLSEGVAVGQGSPYHFVYANPALAEMLGYPVEELTLLSPEEFKALVHPEDQGIVVSRLNIRLKDKAVPSRYEIRLVKKNGTVIRAEFCSRRIYYGGKPSVQMTFVDVTERKQAEQLSRASLERYQYFIEIAGQLGWITNADGEVVEDTPSYRKFTGQTYEEVKGWGWSKALHPEDLERTVQLWKEVTRTKSKYETEFRLRRHDGVYRYFMARGVPVLNEDGSIREWIGTCIDITERKKTEQASKESEERLRSIIENSSDQIFMLDRDCRFLSVNKTAADLFRMSPQEMVDRPISEVLPETIAAQFSKNTKNVFDTGKSMQLDEKMVVEGHELYNSTSLNPVRDDSGRVIAVTGIVRDITERKKTEKMLQESEERFRAIFEGANDGILAADTKTGRFSFANPRICEITGYSLEELLKLGVGDINPKKDLPTVIDSFEKQRQGKVALSKDIPILRKDGRVVYCDVSSKSLKIGSQEFLVGIFRDVTESKKADRELLIKDNAMTSSIDGIVIADLQGNVTYVNPAFVKMWGYDSGKDFIGKSIAEFTQKGQSKEKTDEIMKALGTKGGWAGEMTATRKDGSKFYAILSASLVKDEAGKPICTLGSFVDVTDQKKGEEALKESEERLKHLIEYAPDAIYTNDLEGNFLDGNKQAEALTGYKKEELVGKNMLKAGILPEKYAPKVMQDLMKNMQGQRTGPDEYEFVRKDGTTITAEISSFPMKREGKIEVIGIARDITERKQADKKLRESEEKLRNTIESSPDAITITNLGGIIVDCNQASVRLNGFSSKKELIGKSSLTLVAKKDRTSVDAHYHLAVENIRMAAEAGFLRNALYTLIKKDGCEYPAELSASVLIDASGNPVGFVSVVRDVTERKQMQEKLEEYSQQLEKMVEYRTKQLEDAQQQLVKAERLAAIGQVAAMVGHDLRNPLTGINGAAYYLKMKLGPNTEKNMLEMLNIIERDVQYSNNIITDLTEYSKEIKLELTETTPKSIIEESISLLQIPKKVQLTDSTLNEPRIKIDIEKMKRVFSNFIKNAVEAMPQGGKLTITSRASKNNVELTFVDNGVGMSKDVLEKIWKPFFTTKAKGMGLGLAICRRIIEAHQGKISVESIVGEGTTFTITIPIEPKPRAEGGEKVWVNMPESLLSTTTKA